MMRNARKMRLIWQKRAARRTITGILSIGTNIFQEGSMPPLSGSV
jgi:hypothetical protein